MKIALKFLAMIAAIGLAASGLAQGTNPPTLHIPSLDIPIPTTWLPWLAAHAMALYWLGKLLVKFAPRGKYAWLDAVLWLVEHLLANRDVLPISERNAARTDNGLPSGQTPTGATGVGMGATNIGGKP